MAILDEFRDQAAAEQAGTPVTRIFIATGLSFRNSGWTAWRSHGFVQGPQKVSAPLESSKSAPQTGQNNQ
jgi:hypothetical protein